MLFNFNSNIYYFSNQCQYENGVAPQKSIYRGKKPNTKS